MKLAAAFAALCLAAAPAFAAPALAADDAAPAPSAYDFEFVAIDGEPMPLSLYEGKALLVVNTASLCGFTKQYDGLQKLYETYEEDGLVVIGAPSNDFGGQEPGSAEEIKEFCETNFNIRFPLTDKVVVKGESAHPFYQWARATLGEGAEPKWNFHKILVKPDGSLAAYFPSKVEPMSDELRGAVETALATAE